MENSISKGNKNGFHDVCWVLSFHLGPQRNKKIATMEGMFWFCATTHIIQPRKFIPILEGYCS